MQPETPQGETQVVTDPKTNANPTPAPQVQSVDPEVERLRKEAEQATMRANQLANQLKAKEDAEAAAHAKQLEEQNEFKTLYEQEKARREEIETAQAQAERLAAVKAASDKLFADYPEQVKALAEEAGMSLSSTDDDAVAAFKAKLDKVSGMVAAPKVTANNPGAVPTSSDVSPQDLHKILNDPDKFQEYLRKNYKGISQNLRPAA